MESIIARQLWMKGRQEMTALAESNNRSWIIIVLDGVRQQIARETRDHFYWRIIRACINSKNDLRIRYQTFSLVKREACLPAHE